MLTLAIAHIGHGDDSNEESTRRHRPRCRKPRKEKLLAQLANATASYHHHHWQHANSKTSRTTGHFNASACTENARVDLFDGQSRPLMERSLCPWTVETRRRNTFPRAIAEARCICEHPQKEGSTLRCRPIHYPMIILQKTRKCDERNFIVYEPVRYLVAVGCTCVGAV